VATAKRYRNQSSCYIGLQSLLTYNREVARKAVQARVAYHFGGYGIIGTAGTSVPMMRENAK